MDLQWKPVKNMSANPESVYICPTCQNKVLCHVNYISARIPGCLRQQCGNPEELIRKMVEYRGWKYKSTTPKQGTRDRRVEFICEKNHEASLTFKSLKKGGKCTKCTHQSKVIKPAPVIREICNCKELKLGRQTTQNYICPHYNHGVIYPDSAKEWSAKNEVSVFSVSPSSHKKYIFDCLDRI